MTNHVIPANAVRAHQGQPTTSSLLVAKAFGKQHKNVLRKLESLDCSAEFASANFSAHVQNIAIGSGASRPFKVYQMTKDGFMFLVMGFSGKQAAAIKEAYINEFNRMASELQPSQPCQYYPANDGVVRNAPIPRELLRALEQSAQGVKQNADAMACIVKNLQGNKYSETRIPLSELDFAICALQGFVDSAKRHTTITRQALHYLPAPVAMLDSIQA